MIYTDGTHLTADSLDELYKYANKVGLNTDFIDFGGKNIHPHFDICGKVRQRVLADMEVKKVTCREIVKLCIVNFRLPSTAGELRDWEAHHKQKISDLPLPSPSDFGRMVDNIFKKSGLKDS